MADHLGSLAGKDDPIADSGGKASVSGDISDKLSIRSSEHSIMFNGGDIDDFLGKQLSTNLR